MNITTNDISGISACPDCDLLYDDIFIAPGLKLRCRRCGSKLQAPVNNSLEKTIAMSLTGLILYIPAMFLPIMTISLLGLGGGSSVMDSMVVMFRTGYPFVGVMVLLTSVLFPLVKLVLLFWVSLTLKAGRHPVYLHLFFRWYKHLSEWGMTEVYMLGILVSIIKIHSMGALVFNLGFFCFSSLFLITVASSAVVDAHLFWKLIEGNEPEKTRVQQPAKQSTDLTAKEAGLIRCLDCGKIVRQVEPGPDEIIRCPRCRAKLHTRKPMNVSTTWALLICAMILFLPANILPIMRIDVLGVPEQKTIMDGIILFFHGGDYIAGLIILVASILIPLFKIVGLVLILMTIHFNWCSWLKHKTIMFRFVKFIGRWSFIDIFVIALLASTIRLGILTTIEANPAARYFAAVVIATMFAAIAFDQRTLWDVCPTSVKREEYHV